MGPYAANLLNLSHGFEWTMLDAIGDDTVGQLRANAREQMKGVFIGGVDIDDQPGGLAGMLITPQRSLPSHRHRHGQTDRQRRQ